LTQVSAPTDHRYNISNLLPNSSPIPDYLKLYAGQNTSNAQKFEPYSEESSPLKLNYGENYGVEGTYKYRDY
jgi:hypothetical protein